MKKRLYLIPWKLTIPSVLLPLRLRLLVVTEFIQPFITVYHNPTLKAILLTKILYDIDPIKKVEQSGNSDTSTTDLAEQSGNSDTSTANNSISQSDSKNNISDKNSSDRRSSRAQLDNDYMKAVESGDIKTAQRMVGEAAKEQTKKPVIK